MTFDEAEAHVIPFGDYTGRTIGDVGRSRDGLLFLKKLLEMDALWDETAQALRVYFADETVMRRLDAAIGRARSPDGD